jgi:hypothetical protein
LSPRLNKPFSILDQIRSFTGPGVPSNFFKRVVFKKYFRLTVYTQRAYAITEFSTTSVAGADFFGLWGYPFVAGQRLVFKTDSLDATAIITAVLHIEFIAL